MARIKHEEIGTRIRENRLKRKLSQERLAERAGIVTTHISHIENGNTVPSLKTFISILNALDISADELLVGNIKKARYALEGEMAEIMADCGDSETMIIIDAVRALKESLKRNLKKAD